MAIVVEPISPIAFEILGLQIRWYALSYVAAFMIGYWLVKKLATYKIHSANSKTNTICTLNFENPKFWDDLLAAVILGTIIGGRFGYVLFYNFSYFVSHPLEIFAVWHGGMSFHGGLLGVLISVFLFAKSRNKNIIGANINHHMKNTFRILDMMAVAAPIGLFFGRIANFINMEVMGRPTDSKLGIVFNGAIDQTPRHASPLYEAALEGIVLFIIMFCLWHFTKLRERTGALSGAFAMLYAIFRIFAEQFRAPDPQIGFLTSWGLTMGQLLSALMFIIGAMIFIFARKNNITKK